MSFFYIYSYVYVFFYIYTLLELISEFIPSLYIVIAIEPVENINLLFVVPI